MSTDHYFTVQPASDEQRRTLTVPLAGRSVRVQTARGVFSADRLDPGTRVLLDTVPAPPTTGTLLDLGCGWGPLALTMGLLSPGADVYAVDVNERALDLVRRNAAGLGLRRVRACRPDEVPADAAFTTIWSNPPVRIGKVALHQLLDTWLARLEPGGAAYLVVQRNLGADSVQRWVEAELGMPCERFAAKRGFRVLEIRRGG